LNGPAGFTGATRSKLKGPIFRLGLLNLAPRTVRFTNFWGFAVIPISYDSALLNKIKSKKKIVKKPNTNWYAKALIYKRMLDNRVVASKAELARKEGISRARITQILNLFNLAPEIRNHLNYIADRKDLKILTERRLREITKIKDHLQQIRKFRELTNQEDKP